MRQGLVPCVPCYRTVLRTYLPYVTSYGCRFSLLSSVYRRRVPKDKDLGKQVSRPNSNWYVATFFWAFVVLCSDPQKTISATFSPALFTSFVECWTLISSCSCFKTGPVESAQSQTCCSVMSQIHAVSSVLHDRTGPLV